jgi:hypothetical protein
MSPQAMVRVGVLVSVGLAALARPAAADRDLVRLGRLVAQSQHVLIGTVTAVEQARRPGPMRATVQVEHDLLGQAASVISLQGDDRDPDAPAFATGVRILAFLRANHRAHGEPPIAPVPAVGLEPVEGSAGIIEIVRSGALEATLAIMGRAVDARDGLTLAAVRDVLLASPEPAPRPLVASLLEELTAHPTPADRPLLVEMACDGADAFLPGVRPWAMSEAGSRKLIEARSCLEAQVRAGEREPNSVEAVEALGDMGDRRSVPVLLAILETHAERVASEGPSRAGRDLNLAAVLALGKLGSGEAVPVLARLAGQGNDLALHSTVVHALGLIGGPQARASLDSIGRTHPSEHVRAQALSTRQTLDQKTRRSR